MNVMDILSEMGESPLSEYTWGPLLVSHLNAIAGGSAITTRMSGIEVRSVISTLPAEKQLMLYELQLPPLELTAQMGGVSPQGNKATASKSPTEAQTQQTFFTAMGVGTFCIVLAIFSVAIGVTLMTSTKLSAFELMEEFLSNMLGLIEFVVF